jgi:hypothetical protein
VNLQTHNGKYKESRGISTVLANALLGEAGYRFSSDLNIGFKFRQLAKFEAMRADDPIAGTTVRLGLIRSDDTKIIQKDLQRAPLKPGCQVIDLRTSATHPVLLGDPAHSFIYMNATSAPFQLVLLTCVSLCFQE